MLKENYIIVGGVTLNDLNRNQGFIIYPNPTQGEAFLQINPSVSGKIEVAIYNAIGDLLSTQVFENPVNQVRFDLNREPNGLYFIRILNNNTIIQRKLSLIR